MTLLDTLAPRFYVTAEIRGRLHYLLGPFDERGVAATALATARDLSPELDPGFAFARFDVAPYRVPSIVRQAPAGELNALAIATFGVPQ